MPRTLASYTELADMLESLPVICKESRRVRRLTLRAAANQIGLGFNTLTRFEQGDDAAISNVTKIVRWLAEPP